MTFAAPDRPLLYQKETFDQSKLCDPAKEAYFPESTNEVFFSLDFDLIFLKVFSLYQKSTVVFNEKTFLITKNKIIATNILSCF